MPLVFGAMKGAALADPGCARKIWPVPTLPIYTVPSRVEVRLSVASFSPGIVISAGGAASACDTAATRPRETSAAAFMFFSCGTVARLGALYVRRRLGSSWAEKLPGVRHLRCQTPRHQDTETSAAAPRRERRLAAPPLDHEEGAEHAAEVREVRHAGLRARYAEIELDQAVSGDGHPRRQRNRRDDQHDSVSREIHAGGEQQPEGAARRAERGVRRPHERAHGELRHAGSDHGHEVERDVVARAEEQLEHAAERV